MRLVSMSQEDRHTEYGPRAAVKVLKSSPHLYLPDRHRAAAGRILRFQSDRNPFTFPPNEQPTLRDHNDGIELLVSEVDTHMTYIPKAVNMIDVWGIGLMHDIGELFTGDRSITEQAHMSGIALKKKARQEV